LAGNAAGRGIAGGIAQLAQFGSKQLRPLQIASDCMVVSLVPQRGKTTRAAGPASPRVAALARSPRAAPVRPKPDSCCAWPGAISRSSSRSRLCLPPGSAGTSASPRRSSAAASPTAERPQARRPAASQ
jgi:hypothetical protein